MRVQDVAGYIRNAQNVTIILGAGASLTAGIPSAKALVEQINEHYGHCLTGLSDEDRQDYGKAMSALAPGDRKKLIQPLLDGSRINWGHIALACIIANAKVQRVLTFNFDLVLEKAASLLGMHLPVYDFGVSPTREIAGLAAPAIFHLHGQSYGLRLLNSKEETASHANGLEPILSDSLRNHLTIVAGYSGEADGAFPVIVDAFNSQHNLIWLGYGTKPAKHLKPLFDKSYAEYVGDCPFDNTMIEIAQQLGCFPPEVISNPPRHVLDELKEVVEYPVQSETGLDVLTNVRKRLRYAAEHWEEEITSEGLAERAVVSGEELEPGNLDDMSDAEREARAWQKIRAGNKVYEAAKAADPDEASELFKIVYDRYAEAAGFKQDIPELYFNIGSALSEEALKLSGSKALAKSTEACIQYEKAHTLDPTDVATLVNWGGSLADQSRLLSGNAALETVNLAIEKLKKALEFEPDSSDIYDNWGNALLAAAKLVDNPEKEKFLNDAKSKLQHAKSLSGEAIYNLACYYSLVDDVPRALLELEACLAQEALPLRTFLEIDRDLDNIRDEQRFQDILEQAE